MAYQPFFFGDVQLSISKNLFLEGQVLGRVARRPAVYMEIHEGLEDQKKLKAFSRKTGRKDLSFRTDSNELILDEGERSREDQRTTLTIKLPAKRVFRDAHFS